MNSTQEQEPKQTPSPEQNQADPGHAVAAKPETEGGPSHAVAAKREGGYDPNLAALICERIATARDKMPGAFRAS